MPETWNKKKLLSATLSCMYAYCRNRTQLFALNGRTPTLRFGVAFCFFHRGLPFWHYCLRASFSLLQFVSSRPFLVEACRTASLLPSHMFVAYIVVHPALTAATRFGFSAFTLSMSEQQPSLFGPSCLGFPDPGRWLKNTFPLLKINTRIKISCPRPSRSLGTVSRLLPAGPARAG